MKTVLTLTSLSVLFAAAIGCATVVEGEPLETGGGLPQGGDTGLPEPDTASGGATDLLGGGTGGADAGTGGSDSSGSGGGDAMTGTGGTTMGGGSCAANCKVWTEFGHHTPPPPSVGDCVTGADGMSYTYDGSDGTGVYSADCGPSGMEREMWCGAEHSKFTPCN